MKRLVRGIDPRILRELFAQRRLIVVGLVCSGVAAGLLALVTVFVKLVVAAVEERQPERLAWLSLGVIALFGVKYWFTRGQTYYLSKAANRLTSDLRIRLFEKLQRLPVSYFNEKRAGAIQSVLTNDVNVFQTAISAVRDSVDGPIKVVAGMVLVFALQWQLALAATVVIPIMAYVIQRNGRKMKVAQAEVQRDLGNLTAMMQESLQGTRVIQAFGAERSVAAKFKALVEQSFSSQMRAVRRIASLKPMVELIGAFALAIVVFLCGRLVQTGSLAVSDLSAFLMALDVINQGAKNIGSLNQTLSQVQAATDRIYSEVLDAPEPLADAPDAQTIAHPVGRIEFRNVSFSYPDGTCAVRGLSFVIEPGTSLALVGPSGAGKSTIADLLLRFYDPTEGQILLDDVDLRTLRTEWLRSQIGVVPQQTFLFAGTVEENIRLGLPDGTADDVREAAEGANARSFIDQMPEGLQTELGERGVRLSGGEAQRIAIARALIRRPRILLMDEATSNLDAISEKIVQEALDRIMRGRTTLFIAHRLSTAARADRILMLRRGEAVEQGTFKELMEADGPFASMYRAYASGMMEGEIG